MANRQAIRRMYTALVMVALAVAWCAGSAYAADEAPLAAGDLVYVNVMRHPELSTTSAIDGSGNVQLPYVGNVTLDGLTPAQAAARVGEALSAILKNPRVQVTRSGAAAPAVMSFGERTVEMQTRLVPLNNSSAEVLFEALSGMTSPGGNIGFDPDTNTLIITDTPSALDNIMSVVTQLDEMRSQVTQVHIASRIAEVESTALKELGVKWFVQGDNLSGGYTPAPRQNAVVDAAREVVGPLFNEQLDTGNSNNNFDRIGRRFVDEPNFNQRLNIPVQVPGPGQLFLGYVNVGVDVGLLLDALKADNKAEILASPYIRTVNHKKAEIRMVSEFPYTEIGNVGLSAVTNVEFIELGIVLEVTPHVKKDTNGADYVQIELAPEVSYATGIANGVPVRSVRSSQSIANVADGQTLVIGGIVQTDSRNVVSAVPGVSKLPLVGNLFKHNETSATSRDLMIFVTPTIIGDTENIAGGPGLTFTNPVHQKNVVPPLVYQAEERRE